MEKHIADKSIDDGWIDLEFQRRGIRVGVDMSKHCTFEWDFVVKELSFFVVRASLVGCPTGRMLRSEMFLIMISSKTPRPCHFCSFRRSLTRLCWISLGPEVDAELASNGNHL